MRLDPSRLSVRELRERLAEPDAKVSRTFLRRLRDDPRQGVRALHASIRKRIDDDRRERRRLDVLLVHERRLYEAGVRLVAGVDEVGVGPLAGPVIAAAVVLPPGETIVGVDDSKVLDAADREALEREIRARAVAVGIGVADVDEIGWRNVYHATLAAMRRAAEALSPAPEHLLVDARTIPGWNGSQTAIVDGDALSHSIAAASIVAKVHRDRLMMELDRLHPGYGFARHKGYGTREHRAALRTLGPCAAHRCSLPAVREILAGLGEQGELRFHASDR